MEAGTSGSRTGFDGRQFALGSLQLGNDTIQVVEFTSINRQHTHIHATSALFYATVNLLAINSLTYGPTALFCSLAVVDPRVGHTMDVLSPFISVLCHSDSLIDSSTESPVHALMLSIQAVRGLSHLRAPVIVPCIISFSVLSYKKFVGEILTLCNQIS